MELSSVSILIGATPTCEGIAGGTVRRDDFLYFLNQDIRYEASEQREDEVFDNLRLQR